MIVTDVMLGASGRLAQGACLQTPTILQHEHHLQGEPAGYVCLGALAISSCMSRKDR
jgi:hypothetical protein